MTAVTARRQGHVVEVIPLGRGLGRVDIEGENFGHDVAPGRFSMVEAPGRPDCILLRPYSYFTLVGEHRIGLLVKDVGKGTHGLLTAQPGDPVVVLGPLGTAFPVVSGSVWMVAGGVGAAPFGMPFEASLRATVLFGARTESESGFAQALRDVGADVALATDDGSAGLHGSVVDLLQHKLAAEGAPSAIFTCGPTAMMERVAAVARRAGLPCYASLEERMGCGIGVCRGCAHRDATGGWRCICEDGPVYDAAEIFTDD